MFALATVALPRGQSVAALRIDDQYWSLNSGAMDLFQDWDRSFARLQKFRKRGKPLRGFFKFDFVLEKCHDTMAPVGPAIVLRSSSWKAPTPVFRFRSTA